GRPRRVTGRMSPGGLHGKRVTTAGRPEIRPHPYQVLTSGWRRERQAGVRSSSEIIVGVELLEGIPRHPAYAEKRIEIGGLEIDDDCLPTIESYPPLLVAGAIGKERVVLTQGAGHPL